jgi:uncharacterized protein YbcI
MPGLQLHSSRATVGAAIAKATGHLLNEYTGRGPTRSRTYMNEELITVMLIDTLSTGERSLVREGNDGLVMELRKAYQRAMGPELVAMVERLSGQRVIAFLSDNHLNPDLAIECFVMAPSHAGVRLHEVNAAETLDGAPS